MAKETKKQGIPKGLPPVVRKGISQMRRDIQDWNNAKRLALMADNPKQYLLQDIYTQVVMDAYLSSQINNRFEITQSTPFELIDSQKKVNEQLTQALNDIPCITDIFENILQSNIYGYSLVDLGYKNDIPAVFPVNRRNVSPDFGRFYPDTSQDKYLAYRELPFYNIWLQEFNAENLGLLDKVVAAALFKRFALSCWSEYCEICGIPPRYLKTNTQDPAMLDRGEKMMREFGAAAWFLIDTTEDLQFANSITHNGDVYDKLIIRCNQEMSMAISGALIGQDTLYGNRSKEETSIQILDRLVQSDKRLVERYMNFQVLPAMIQVGWLPAGDFRFRFSPVTDTEKLWAIVKDLLPYKEVDDEFILNTFGVPVKGGTGEGVNGKTGERLNGNSVIRKFENSKIAKDEAFLLELQGGDADFFE